MAEGMIIKHTGSWYTVRLENGDDMECRIRGKFRLKDLDVTNPVAVGDRVVCEQEPDQQTGIITEVRERDNYIIRSTPHLKSKSQIIAANVDQALLMVTLAAPRTSPGFIDRFLVTCEAYDIPASLAFNKKDTYSEDQLQQYQEMAAAYQKAGYASSLISAKTEENLEAVREVLTEQKTLLSGHSGVGKSTLINKLIPSIDLKTKRVSDDSGKGKHATSYVGMYELSFGGWIIDTPGIKEFGLVDMELNELAFYFPEMRQYLDECKFHNCLHHEEPGCAVKGAVEEEGIAEFRYQSYLKLLTETEHDIENRYS